MPVTSRWAASDRGRERRTRDERGAVAILTAASLVGLLIVTGMVLDFGLVRLDRQNLKVVADSGALAGASAGDDGTGDIFTHRAVCGALAYIRQDTRFAGLPESICASATLAANASVKCDAAAPGTARTYDQPVSYGGASYRVIIKAPYQTTEGGWSEESLSTLAGDQSTRSGCDQIGVQILGSRSPGLGSLATDDDLTFGIRSAARALTGMPGQVAPALVLLERQNCSALTVGAAGGGAGTFIKVNGTGDTPGSIHVDSAATGADCGTGSNQQLIQGKQNDGVVAYGSPSPTGISGIITSVATFNGQPDARVFDLLNYVYGTTATSGTGTPKYSVQGRPPIHRTPIDKRYRAPVRAAINGVSAVWDNQTAWEASGGVVVGCSPGDAVLASATKLWIQCPDSNGITLTDKTIAASEIYFNGFVKNGNVAMPNATRVYVSNTGTTGARINSSAITFGNNNGFCVRGTCGLTEAAKCPSTPGSARARVFIRRGQVSVTGGTFRLCSSTMFMLGGDTANGCVPASDGAAPTATPCPASSTPAGTGQLDVGGGTVFDWTAPNQYAELIPAESQATAWDNFEDLAMWSESHGLFKFAGGGGMRTVGVYMVPNATPVSVGGGSSQVLNNAQYIARTFSVSGGGTLTLTTDPRNAVTLPERVQVLVR